MWESIFGISSDLTNNLSIGNDQVVLKNSPASQETLTRLGQKRRQELHDTGYTLVDEPTWWSDENDHSNTRAQDRIESLVQAIARLEALGYPATFCFLLDQTWELAAYSFVQCLQPATTIGQPSKHEFCWDVLAWYIGDDQIAGFSPHRDRQPDTGNESSVSLKESFDKGHAKFLTHWIALTPATTETSCLYMIPKPYDPGYQTGDFVADKSSQKEETEMSSQPDLDPLQRALPDKCAFQHIRAMPRQPGQSIVFTHRILHWGSARDVRKQDVPPRIAISFVSSDPSFEKPYIVNSSHYFAPLSNDADDSDNKDGQSTVSWRIPPFAIRLLIICSQLLIYHERFQLPKRIVKLCYDYCKRHETYLEETYRQKVFYEFVRAMNKCDDAETTNSKESKARPNGEVHAKFGNDEDDEEAMMEEMLNAEEGGYGEFQDDFDELGDADDASVDGDDELNEEMQDTEESRLFGPSTKKQKV